MPMFRVESCVAGKRVFTVTSAFSWQNSVNLCPASFCIPRSNLPVSRWLLTSYFCILVPYDEKHIFFALQNLWHSDKEMPAQNVTLLSYVLHAQLLSHVWLCDPVDCSLPDSSVHGIFQARILEWVAISFSTGSSRPRDWTCISCITGVFLTTEPPGKLIALFFAFTQLNKSEMSSN